VLAKAVITNGTISRRTDTDYFTVSLSAAGTLNVTLTPVATALPGKTIAGKASRLPALNSLRARL